ncbi:hypothetical protein [Duganella radicis]|uniref:Uncharacterized protein n=1 Tax=Duganella radicis TaxID=551988 RepID=A0A6L6PCW8_9BURK|nr:hypothetical protein [Duganella radicis]MTV36367.1 hypothetical protein [Duganella radicis]
MTNACYSFLPWYRRGLGGLVTGVPPAGAQRPTVQVTVNVGAEPAGGGAVPDMAVPQTLSLYGPGDVTGIDPHAVIRCEPGKGISNVEPNYLASIEFYDEDLPWRYSPEGPTNSGLRLAPWLALVVLAEGECKDGRDLRGRPLPFVEVAGFDPFPPRSELWAWAHVHVNASLSGTDAEFISADMAQVLPRLDALLAKDADAAYSRLVCPRRLEPNTSYTALLIPAYETGRLAGLGHPPTTAPSASAIAWDSYPGRLEALLVPYYYRWQFRTAEVGDFETLVRRLKARVVDAKVGYRDIDVQRPGLQLPGIASEELGGILKLGGALRAPESALDPAQLALRKKYEEWDVPPHAFQAALAGLINLGDDYLLKPAPDAHAASGAEVGTRAEDGTEEEVSPDPLVLPPLYGRWHAAVDRLLTQADGSAVPHPHNWVHNLNLDPRHRAAAAAGTTVIQKGQETYMDAAWGQVGDVLKANRKLRHARYAIEISAVWHERRFGSAAKRPERYLRLTRPVHRRVLSGAASVRAQLERSRVRPALLSYTASRLLRPGGRLLRLASLKQGLDREALLKAVNDGSLRIASVKAAPRGLYTTLVLAEKSLPRAIERQQVPAGRADAALAMARLLSDRKASAQAFGKIKLDVIGIMEPGQRDPGRGKNPEQETHDLGLAANAWFDLVGASYAAAERPELQAIDIDGVGKDLHSALDPRIALRNRTLRGLEIPQRLLDAMPEEFDEIWAHPVIDTPMYQPLQKESTEFLMPGLHLVEPDSITAVTTNQAFIEAYMVGLNHEFARELLWREYPTDQRGSVFRQFWDVRGQVAPPGADPDVFRDSLRDIPKIHQWPRASTLGKHDNREPPGEQKENVVLLIRGELLKKYPNMVIYAQRAKWGLNGSNQPDVTRERELIEVAEAQMDNPPHDLLRFPLFEAKVEPDVYFFGFDLDEAEAKGRVSGPPTADNAGWFFVLKERPGEPRFGFDTSRGGGPQTVNDIIWSDLIPAGSTRQFIDPAVPAPVLAPLGGSDHEKDLQRADDVIVLTAQVSAARWAYLLYQAPMMVAIHAAELLKRT